MSTVHREAIRLYRSRFLEAFGIDLPKFYANNALEIEMLGFDVIKFDDYLNPPDGTSTYDHIVTNYGEDAAQMIKSLLAVRTDLFTRPPT